MPESGPIQHLRDRLSARRAESRDRAHKRKAVAAQREAEKAKRRKQSAPPSIGGGVRLQPALGYFQRLMKSAVAGLTSSGFEALRKCWPPSTTRSSAPGLLTKSFISSSALATE